MKRLFAGLLLASASVLAFAVPTLKQVEDEVQAGRYTQAETMMSEVVAAKGDSAKAHYIYAEVLAHNGKFAKAAEEARSARRIDPDIKFTSADKFRTFEQTLQREQNPAVRSSVTNPPVVMPSRPVAPAERGIPSWVWIAGLAAIAFFLWRGFSRSRAAAPAAYAPGGGMMGSGPGAGAPPYGPGYGPGYAPPAQGGGSGLLGTGLAVAGGVAGGMMLDRMLHHGDSANNGFAQGGGGQGYVDNSGDAARELENRPVDFGTGNDWDSGGSSDAGSGSDGGGGWD